MPSRTLPNLGLTAFFDLGENGWDDDMSLNLLLLSTLTQAGVLETVSATPSTPTDGQVYLFDETHPTQANKIAIRDAGAWIYVTPLEGWRVYDRDANVLRLFNGTVWTEFTSGGGGGSLPAGGTDGQVLTKQSSTDGDADWETPASGGGGGGGMVLIDLFTATGGETSVDFTGIPATFNGLKIVIYARGDAATGDTGFDLQFNGDTGANYFYRQTFFPSGAASADNQTYARTVQFAAGTAPTNQFDSGTIDIPFYASTDGHKTLTFHCFNSEGSTQYRTINGGALWKSTDAIDEIMMLVGTGGMAAGSRVALYGY